MRPFSAVASLGLALLAASAACSGSAPGGASAGDDGGASAEGGAAGSSSGPGSDGGASRDGSASGSSGGSSSGSSSGSSGSSGSSSGSSSGGSSGSSGGGTHCDSLLVTGIASNQIAYYGEGFYGSGQPPQVQVEMTFAYTQAVPNGKLMVSYVQFGTADDAKLDGTHALDPSTTNAPCNFDDTICVALWDGTTLWGPVSGTLTLGDTTTPISEESTGSLANVRLTPLTLNASTGKWESHDPGKCKIIQPYSWDTRVALGASCQTASDCGDTLTKACDPATARCITPVCGNGPTLIAACPSGQECLEQAYEPSGGGACYTKCTPPTAGASTCPAGTTCIQVDYRGQTGACEALGTAQRGQACTYSQIASGCADGSQCVVEEAGSFCRGQCSIWGSAACDSGQRCVAGGYCTADVYDPAPLGSNCATGHDNYYCGDDGTAYRGICVTGCQKICRATSDCPANHTCAYLAGTDLGVCNQN